MPFVRVRGITKRQQEPKTLSIKECRTVLAQLKDPHWMMVVIAMCLGLRVSEILGLQWNDFDWENLCVTVQRSYVLGHHGDVKTRYSKKRLPLDPSFADALFKYKRNTELPGVAWVFANPETRKPWMAHQIQQHHLIPAGKAAGVGWIGWHTFRHSYSTQLRELGVDVKVQQELLRHADIRTTMNVYTHSIPPAEREANSKVVRMVIGA
jgi:integrase